MSETKLEIVNAPRPAPKRKFVLTIGGLELTKRIAVEELASELHGTEGVGAVLILDGYSFELLDRDPVF